MKATLWLWSLVSTMLCISQSVYSSPLTDYRYLNTRDLQDSYLTPKRTGPSLSIVNPLDVLRQRLLLEIARRQMKENTKQVELNRQILKNVGKRDDGLYDLDYYDIDHNLLTNLNHPIDNNVYQKFQPQQQQPSTNNINSYLHHNRDQSSSAAAAIASGLVADHAKFLNDNLLNSNNNNNLLNNNIDNNLIDDNNNNLDNTNTNNNNNVNNNNINDNNDDDYQIKYIYSLHKNKPNNIMNMNTNSNKNNNYSH